MSHLNFTWTPVTELADGTTTTDPITYDLYENGVKVVSDIAQPSFSLLMDGKQPATYSYSVTAVDTTTAEESAQSVPVAVVFQPPKSPTGLSYTFSAS